MSAIRNLISAWLLALIGSLLFPLTSVAAVSGTMHNQPGTITTTPVSLSEHITVGEGQLAASSLWSVARAQEGALLGFCRILNAPKKTITNPNRLLPERAGPTAHISPREVAGQTPAQINANAQRLGLQPRGPNPSMGQGSYIDPQTGVQRILSHPNAATPHGHVNAPSGARISISGQVVAPEAPAAHLPINYP